MKPKTMMLMVVAVGCGLAASYMTSRLLAERGNGPVEEPKVKVLVSKTKVPAWILLKEPDKYFEEKEVPESAAPKKALREFKDVENQRLSQAMGEGEYVLADKIVNAEQVGLIAKLPPGMRAIAIKVNAESLVGGFVLPGYRVDVVSTLRGGASESVSKIILQNMLVLAVDQAANRDNQTTTMLGNTVTLAATAEEANRLALAAAMGELRLTLRTPDDNKIVRLPGTKWDDLSKPTRDPSAQEEDVPLTTSAPVPQLPKDLPPPATPATPVTQQAPEKQPEKAKEPEKIVQTHTLTIREGEFARKAVFLWDQESNTWQDGRIDRSDDAPRRRTPRRSAQPESVPAPVPDGPNAPGDRVH